jgi:hypothetical protein
MLEAPIMRGRRRHQARRDQAGCRRRNDPPGMYHAATSG